METNFHCPRCGQLLDSVLEHHVQVVVVEICGIVSNDSKRYEPIGFSEYEYRCPKCGEAIDSKEDSLIDATVLGGVPIEEVRWAVENLHEPEEG